MLNKNAESHFSLAPVDLDMGRSIFNRDHGQKTTFNAGNLIPIYIDEVLPGDTFNIQMGMALRMATPIFPIMDNMNIDIQFYFVPNRLVWEHWEEFLGVNKTSAWEQETEYTIPQIEAPTDGWTEGTIADYFNIPTKIDGISVSALPFRAYVKIWNDWFRDENIKQPAMMNVDDTTVTGANSGDYVTYAQLGAEPLKAAKYHDMFTSALIEPQKGPPVGIPIEMPELSGTFPVYGNGKTLGFVGKTGSSTSDENFGIATIINGNNSGIPFISTQSYNKDIKSTISTSGSTVSATNSTIGITTDKTGKSGMVTDVTFENSNSGEIAFTINQLREAFAIQRFYEKAARGGTRIQELLKANFGVTSPDARLQRAEYLGGARVPINIDQVLQTSSTDATTPQGNTAAYSLTNFAGDLVSHSFVEHGYVIGLAVVRQNHTYQQGIDRMWSRKTKFDFYWPTLANLGEVAILNKEIYAQGEDEVDEDGNIVDEKAFGYQEAWYDYRYKTDHVNGLFRSNATGTLDSWHLADDYEELPLLSSSWIDESEANIDRVIAVPSQPQFIADFYFKNTCARVMPLYSIPGLIDHH